MIDHKPTVPRTTFGRILLWELPMLEGDLQAALAHTTDATEDTGGVLACPWVKTPVR